ncbi:MAG: hypothetical protein ACI8WA_001112 [Polaribacter sp.]|jgi:hypothetical protein
MKARVSQLSVLFFVFSLFFTTAIQAQDSSSSDKKVKVSEKILKSYVGTYSFDQGIGADITLKDGKLYGEQTGSGQPAMELVAIDKNKFKIEAMGAEIVFSTNDKGQVTGLTFYQQGQEMFATKD